MSKYVEVCQWQDIITSTFNHLKVAKLEAEVKKWKLEVCKWQDIDTENQETIERLEAEIVMLKTNSKRLKEYDEHGAVGDGITDDTKAVTECYENADSVRPTPRELLSKPRQG